METDFSDRQALDTDVEWSGEFIYPLEDGPDIQHIIDVARHCAGPNAPAE